MLGRGASSRGTFALRQRRLIFDGGCCPSFRTSCVCARVRSFAGVAELEVEKARKPEIVSGDL